MMMMMMTMMMMMVMVMVLITEAGLPAEVAVHVWGFPRGLGAGPPRLMEAFLVTGHSFFHLEIYIASKTLRGRKSSKIGPPNGLQNS